MSLLLAATGYALVPATRVTAGGPTLNLDQCSPTPAVCANATASTFGSGATLTLSGSGFAPTTILAVWLEPVAGGNGQLDTGEPFAQVTTDNSGGFTGRTLLVAGVPAAAYEVQAGDCPIQNAGSSAPCMENGHPTTELASIPVVVNISASPYKFGAGSTITVTGYGFAAGSALNVWFDANGNSTLDAGETPVALVAAPDGSFSTPLLVRGQPGSRGIDAGPLTAATAATTVGIGTCWFQDCFIDGADTICLFGNSPSDLFTFFADCKAVDSNYTNPVGPSPSTNCPGTLVNTPPGGYDLCNKGPRFMGAGALAALTNDLGPPGTGCTALEFAKTLATNTYGNTVPDFGFNLGDPLTRIEDIGCSPNPACAGVPCDLITYTTAEGILGHSVPDSGTLFALATAINTAATVVAPALAGAACATAIAAAATALPLVSAIPGLDPLTAGVMASSIGAAVSVLPAATCASGPLLTVAILLAAQTAVAEGAIAGAIVCGFVDYYCDGSDITANIIGHPALQQAAVSIPFLQPPFADPPDRSDAGQGANPCRAALGDLPLNGTCWGDIIGWGQVACTRISASPDNYCELPGALANYPNLPIPGAAGVNNQGAPNKCATGEVHGLSIGYDGDVSFDMTDPTQPLLVNYHNFMPGPGGSDPPGGIDVEIPLNDSPQFHGRNFFLPQITELRPGMHVHVCGQSVADMDMLWNELHPITSLTVLIAATGKAIATTEGNAFSGTVAAFTAPSKGDTADQFSATVDWGDGTSSSGTVTGNTGSFTVTGGHTYAEEGTRTVTVSIADSQDANDTATVTGSSATADAALSGGTPITVSATEGQAFTGVVASFTDADSAGTATDYSATITWGDGNASSGSVAANGSGGFDVSGSNTYAEEGTYTISVAVSDAGGSTTSPSGTAHSPDATLAASGLAFNSTNPVQNRITATFTDADPAGAVGDYTTATIDWGDGTATSNGSVALATGHFTVSGSHTYAALGPYAITTHVCDLGGSCATATSSVLVFAYSTGGSFAVGDKTVGAIASSTGRQVYFWGSSWASKNSLSGGSAPSQFKGFEDSPTIPGCGLQWTTNAGDNVPAPTTIPTYMAVIVSSKITAKPSTALTGNELHVVIVKTNLGYTPDPSTPGTGTIVGVIC